MGFGYFGKSCLSPAHNTSTQKRLVIGSWEITNEYNQIISPYICVVSHGRHPTLSLTRPFYMYVLRLSTQEQPYTHLIRRNETL